ncbi:Tn3 family transposase [Streptomyces sp. I8-5]|uniref:Tn3 family transposase n=1 Tax=Streptomyces sp. I8-5 TaxID=3104277 RepID=UPI0038691489
MLFQHDNRRHPQPPGERRHDGSRLLQNHHPLPLTSENAALKSGKTTTSKEDQLAALGLVLNAVVLWNTRYLDAAVARLRAAGHDIKDEDVARLSQLKDRHINFLGRYLFNIKASGPGQGLRPFRDPDAIEDKGEGC